MIQSVFILEASLDMVQTQVIWGPRHNHINCVFVHKCGNVGGGVGMFKSNGVYLCYYFMGVYIWETVVGEK